MSRGPVDVRLTRPQADALLALLAIVLNDPEFADAAAMSQREWAALGRAEEAVQAARS